MYCGQCPCTMANVHVLWPMFMSYGQCPCTMDNVHEIAKKIFCPWAIDAHGQLSTKRTRPKYFNNRVMYMTLRTERFSENSISRRSERPGRNLSHS
jgi:hypothetical protein